MRLQELKLLEVLFRKQCSYDILLCQFFEQVSPYCEYRPRDPSGSVTKPFFATIWEAAAWAASAWQEATAG